MCRAAAVGVRHVEGLVAVVQGGQGSGAVAALRIPGMISDMLYAWLYKTCNL